MAVRLVGGSAPEPPHQEPETETTGAHPAGAASSPQPQTGTADTGHAAPDSASSKNPPAQTALQQQLYAQLALANGKSPPISSTQLSKDVASLGGRFTQQKLQTLKSALSNQPPQVLAQTLKNPNVQQLLQGAGQWIAKGGTADQVSSNLAQAVKGLPPQYAAQVVQESLPAIEQEKPDGPPTPQETQKPPSPGLMPLSPPSQVDFHPAATFKNLSSALGTLDSSPASQAIINQVAKTYANSLTSPSSSYAGAPSLKQMDIPQAIKQGASPRLALALASQLASSGQPSAAMKIATSLTASGVKPDSMLPLANQLAGAGDSAGAQTLLNNALRNTDASHINALQGDINQDVDQYNKLLPDLKATIGETQGVLTPQQLQKAINNYKPMQPVLAKMKADVQALNRGIAQRTSLEKQYPSLKGLLSGPAEAAAGDKNVRTAVSLMAQKDPKIFAGGPDSDAGKAFSFWSDQASRDQDLGNALIGAYLNNDVLRAFDELRTSHNSPEAVAQVKQALQDLKGKYKLLGAGQTQVGKAVVQLNHVLNSYTTGESLDKPNTQAETSLTNLSKIFPEHSAAGTLLGGLGVALAGAALVGAAKDYKEDKSPQSALNLLSASAGLGGGVADAAKTQTAVRAAARVGVHIDPDGFISVVAEKANRFAGAADAAQFFVGAISDLSSKDYRGAALNTVGGVGAAVAAASEESAPYGIGLVIGAGALIYEHDQNVKHTSMDKAFMEGGGVGPKQAAVLSTNSAREGEELGQQLDLSPQQLQSLAADHPNLFNSNDSVTQTFINAAQACGVKGDNTLPFANALAEDDPQGKLLNQIAVQRSTDSIPLSAVQAQLHQILTGGGYPKVTSFLKQHKDLRQELSKAAHERSQAVLEYDTMRQSGNTNPAQATVSLLRGQGADFQAEIIKQMHQNKSLGEWVQKISQQGPESSVQTARTALQAAENERVLSSAEASQYLKELRLTPS